MPYDHTKQYRCTIVRGKAYKDLDNLLIIYASIVNEICPCTKDEFAKQFNIKLAAHLGSTAVEKTLSNHRTEIAGKLFGMYYGAEDGMIYCSTRVNKLLEDSDQPAYFKELLLKYQFPIGMSKISTVAVQVSDGIRIRQFPFLIQLLSLADEKKVFLSKIDIGYYVLNNLDVLTCRATPTEVLNQIIKDKRVNFKREIKEAGKESSYLYQHINEQLNLLVLANLVYYDNDLVILNKKEKRFLDVLLKIDYSTVPFNFNNYDLDDRDGRMSAEYEWDLYFSGQTNEDPEIFVTSASAIIKSQTHDIPQGKPTRSEQSTVEIGDEGEVYVFNYECSRVKKINPRLLNRIKLLGKIRGLGYDIHSVYGEGRNADFAKYIEVKSTKRVTTPELNFLDSINLTRNEWSAAQQHKENYHIYRLYFTNDGVKLFVIENPFEKSETGLLSIEAIAYRLEFSQNVGVYLNEQN